MHVAAFLPPHLLSHLHHVLGDAHSVEAAEDLAQLSSLLRSGSHELLIVDPAIQNGELQVEIEEVVARERGLPVVVYTALAPMAMRAMIRLAAVGVRHVVLHRFDDEPRRFLELIERVPVHPMAEMMLQELAESLRQLPTGVVRVIEQLLRSPHTAGNAQELAERAGMSSRSLYRHLAPAGVQPRQLIVCARLLRGYTLIREPGSRLKEISAKLGYADPDTLSHLLQSWTGLGVKELRQGVAPREFVRLLAEHLRQGDNGEG